MQNHRLAHLAQLATALVISHGGSNLHQRHVHFNPTGVNASEPLFLHSLPFFKVVPMYGSELPARSEAFVTAAPPAVATVGLRQPNLDYGGTTPPGATPSQLFPMPLTLGHHRSSDWTHSSVQSESMFLPLPVSPPSDDVPLCPQSVCVPMTRLTATASGPTHEAQRVPALVSGYLCLRLGIGTEIIGL